LLAVQEILSVVKYLLLDSGVENDRTERSLGARSDKLPLIPGIVCVYEDRLRFCDFPGALRVEQQLVDYLVVTSKDPGVQTYQHRRGALRRRDTYFTVRTCFIHIPSETLLLDKRT
jgi:hypothetical protein